MVLALAQCDLACSRESHRKLLLSLIYCLHNVLCDEWLLLPYLRCDLGASHAFIVTIQQRIDGADDTVTTIAYGFDPRTPYVGFGKRVQCGSCADSNANAGFGNRIRPPLYPDREVAGFKAYQIDKIAHGPQASAGMRRCWRPRS